MGTEIQSKMYLPGYYTIPTLTSNVGHGGWSLLHQNKTLKNGQHHDILSTRLVVDGFHECSKEQVKQMILKHESMFKHQLNELHRLYKRQKDLMDEIKSKEVLKHQKAAAASQLPLFSSGFPLVGSDYHKPSMSTTGISSQSYCISIANTQPTSCGPNQSGVKKLHRRLFNLELPADEYISDGEPEGVLLGPATETYPHIRRNEAKVLFNRYAEASSNNSGPLSSGLYLERSYMTTLNESIQVDKMSASTNVYKGVWPFPKKFPENPQLGKDGGVSTLHLKNESNQREWLTNAPKEDQTKTYFGGSFGLPDSKKPCEPSYTEARKACEPAKRTIFGIEISDRDLKSSAEASKSYAATISESLPTWAGPPSSLSNNWTSVQANSFTSTRSNRASIMLQQKPEVTIERLLLDCNSISSTPGLKGELSHQNGVCFRTKIESNELQSYKPLISVGFPYADGFTPNAAQWHYSSGGCRPDAKPSTYVHDNKFVQRLGNQEAPQGRLHWLESASLCKGPVASAVDNDISVKVGFVKGDAIHDHAPLMCREQLEAQNDKAHAGHQIDLNRCLTEEETPIDVQAAVIVAGDVNVGEVSEEKKCKEEAHDGLISVAAKALVAISSQAHTMQENAAHCLDQISSCREGDVTVVDNSLLWFAEIASSNEQNLGQTDEDSSLNSMDYFEYMTLNMAETKIDHCCNVAPENPKEEMSLSKRPQRGQTRRGRQRKDFQRDVLPGIACLSRNEVTDDLQTFEGSIRSSGGSWQSGFSQKNAGKPSGGRGRKRLGTCTLSPTSTVQGGVSQPQMEQQPQCVLLQEPEERNTAVTGWGKRTRRPPRQRYPIYSPVSQK
ncbi:uncharacterized protein LOC126799360 [Argentina anserina]|uniref:uncharacterized protein LOC126799360 n=1 Tax=Argentina anserina TaxID=57926 RepID=UPI002176819B|nr:uncharacterized protein LOC126799360 [Potentilla anserina]